MQPEPKRPLNVPVPELRWYGRLVLRDSFRGYERLRLGMLSSLNRCRRSSSLGNMTCSAAPLGGCCEQSRAESLGTDLGRGSVESSTDAERCGPGAGLLACFLTGLTLIIVRRVAGTTGFVVQPRRWVVERSLGWLGRWRRLSKDYEALPEVSKAMVTLAAIRLMLHRLAHPNRKRLPAHGFPSGLPNQPKIPPR